MSRRCIRCNVNIVDDAIECPLCHGVLETGKGDEHSIGQESVSLTYPDVTASLKWMQIVIRAVTFAALVVAVTVLMINYYTFDGVYWSFIVIAGLAYGVITLLYSFRERKSIQKIILTQMIFSIPLLIALDSLTGGDQWAYKYALPILFMGVDVGALVLMIVGIDGWQNYIMTEITTMFFSIILLILHFTGLVDTSYLTVISVAVTGFILLGTIMFGSRMVSNEIKRRFKI